MPELATIKIPGKLAAAQIYPKESPKCHFGSIMPPECAAKTNREKYPVDRAVKRMILAPSRPLNTFAFQPKTLSLAP